MIRRSTTLTITFTAALLTLSLAIAGCAHDETKPATVPTTATVVLPSSVALAPASPGKTNSTIYLSDSLRKACGITAIESVREAPKFEFDQSAILPEDRDVLAQVAQCLTMGPLKGRSITLIGRADPRGAQEYNMALGERRSDAAMKYLTDLGVGARQMGETSRGALDAKGSDEAGWRDDRRVDIDVLGSPQ
jgi:peptidoglycan-associated lipoprotein